MRAVRALQLEQLKKEPETTDDEEGEEEE